MARIWPLVGARVLLRVKMPAVLAAVTQFDGEALRFKLRIALLLHGDYPWLASPAAADKRDLGRGVIRSKNQRTTVGK